jgi:hypothetical protein
MLGYFRFQLVGYHTKGIPEFGIASLELDGSFEAPHGSFEIPSWAFLQSLE